MSTFNMNIDKGRAKHKLKVTFNGLLADTSAEITLNKEKKPYTNKSFSASATITEIIDWAKKEIETKNQTITNH